MKKLSRIILSIVLIVPMLVGCLSTLGIFSSVPNLDLNSPSPSVESSMGGGGQNSLTDPIEPDFPQISDDNDDVEAEVTEYVFKPYEYYFIDYFNLPEELYTVDETTSAVTIDYTNIKKTTTTEGISLSHNDNVFYTVTSDDLTGSGSESDPYVVHSTNGFLYLTNSSFLGSQQKKFVEIKSDVILNDESFDENGNPKGGDGVVYNFQRKLVLNKSEINGNAHYIMGVYLNYPTSENVGLFMNSTINKLENINYDNFYICGKTNVYSVAGTINNLISVNLYHGYVCASDRHCYGYAGHMGYVSDCNSYANVTGLYDVGGFCRTVDVIENSNNYGRIKGSSNNVAGFLANKYTKKDMIISNCKNYGDIYGGSEVAGILTYHPSNDLIINNCVNYGNINATSNAGGILGALALDAVGTIFNCSNYGNIINNKYLSYRSCGALVGQVNGKMTLQECKAQMDMNVSTTASIIGSTWSFNHDVIVQKIQATILNFKNNTAILGDLNLNTKLHIQNLDLNISSTTDKTVRLFSVENSTNTFLNLKNIMCKIDFNSTINILSGKSFPKENRYFDSMLLLGAEKNEYIGENFSGFYFSWKTGKVGLVAFDGRGTFQGQIDEEWLVRKGYQKKEI